MTFVMHRHGRQHAFVLRAAPHLLAHPEGVRNDDQLRALKPVQVGLHRLLEALRTRSSTG